MAARNPQTMAKRDREQAVKERRDRKRAKKAEAAAQRTAAKNAAPPADIADGDGSLAPAAPEQPPQAPGDRKRPGYATGGETGARDHPNEGMRERPSSARIGREGWGQPASFGLGVPSPRVGRGRAARLRPG